MHAFSLFFRLRGGVPAEHEGLAGVAALAPDSRSRPWCTMRSPVAAASLSSAKTVPHVPDSMFAAEMMLRLS